MGALRIPGVGPATARGATVARPPRLLCVDAFRGLVMLLLWGEVLHSCDVAQALPGVWFWSELCRQQSHAAWVGLHLHDLIQPGFTFLVGASMPLSIASRRRQGRTDANLIGHALVRSIVLIALGIAMMSIHPRQILWKLEDTLCQIGLGYAFVFGLALARPRAWWIAFWAILAAWFLLFALSPLPPPDFDYAAVGVSADWLAQHGLSGWQAHWQKNANIAYAADLRWLPLLPGNAHYVAPTGLTTLNFVPTMATMLLGVIASHRLTQGDAPARVLRDLLFAAAAGLAVGGLLAFTGLCPLIKSLWTSSWVLVSGGCCLLLLAFFYALVEMRGQRAWVFPLVVVGMNSLFAYVLQHAYPALAWGSLRRLFGAAPFAAFGPALEPFVYGVAVMGLYWLLLWGLWRRRWFIRI